MRWRIPGMNAAQSSGLRAGKAARIPVARPGPLSDAALSDASGAPVPANNRPTRMPFRTKQGKLLFLARREVAAPLVSDVIRATRPFRGEA